ncbi:MAG: O-antigen ligase family protein [Bacteroidota bacterium]
MKESFFKLEKSNVVWFYILTILIASLSAYGYVKGYIVALALPFLFIFAIAAIFRFDLLIYLAVLVTPFSINLAKTGIGIGVSLPSEPLMFGIFLIFWIKVLAEGGLDKRILSHPVTWMIFLHVGWYTITTITSTMPVVSIKSTLARYCYISVFYFSLLYLFIKKQNIHKFLWAYMLPLLGVCIITMLNQAAAGFTEQNAHIAMVPYYNDHTAYAAVIALFIPVIIALLLENTISKRFRSIIIIVAVLLITAIILSYTRAAWVALAGALGCLIIYALKIKNWVVYSGIVLVILSYALFHVQITMYLEKNDKTSSTDYTKHVQSIGNISTDDSNIERLNRWSCALRMFNNKPFLGYGPGTYMFQYGQFQKYSERSGISTNFAEGGGSHSEYLGPLSEQGILGPVTFILILAVLLQRTSTFLRSCKNRNTRIVTRGLVLGLVTYIIHGGLNYFLDTEKLAVPFWGFIACIVAFDIYYQEHQIQESNKHSAA